MNTPEEIEAFNRGATSLKALEEMNKKGFDSIAHIPVGARFLCKPTYYSKNITSLILEEVSPSKMYYKLRSGDRDSGSWWESMKDWDSENKILEILSLENAKGIGKGVSSSTFNHLKDITHTATLHKCLFFDTEECAICGNQKQGD